MADNYSGVSPYCYVLNNPISNLDPDGMGPIDFLLRLLGIKKDDYLEGSWPWGDVVVTAQRGPSIPPGSPCAGQIYAKQVIEARDEFRKHPSIGNFLNMLGRETQLIPGVGVIGATGSEVIEKSLEYAMKEAKFVHLFKEKHILQPLVERLGGEKNFLTTIIKSIANENLSPGKFEVVKNIEGTSLTIRGFIDADRTVKLGTIFKH